ncbi:MAG TPA: regulatory protein RecX [Streptosporangiaceae bacterium]
MPAPRYKQTSEQREPSDPLPLPGPPPLLAAPAQASRTAGAARTAGTAGASSATPEPAAPDLAAPDLAAPGAATADLGPEALGRQICLRLLTTAPRTRAQLTDAMHRRGVPDHVAESVLDQLTRARLIDDAAFAKAWVESRHHGRGLSRRTLSAELRQRGVESDDITEAVETLDPDQEVETARHLAERKLAATRGQPPEVRKRKVAGMLARKGYSPGLAYRLIREILEQEGEILDQEGAAMEYEGAPADYEALDSGED